MGAPQVRMCWWCIASAGDGCIIVIIATWLDNINMV